MSDQPKTSIITSTYNRADMLRRAIDSVRAQTVDDWEMCIVGDCTPDHTEEVIASYQDPRLRFYNLPEKSPEGSHGAIAKNHAIFDMARGTYISYLDDDDTYLPNFLKNMVFTAEQHPECGVIYCRAKYRNKHTGRRVFGNPFQSRAHRWSREKLMRYNFLVSNGVIHKRSILDDIGGWNPDDFLDDYDLWKRIAMKYEFHYLDEVLCEVYIEDIDPFLLRALKRGIGILFQGRRIDNQ